jgi:hypothetical protein
MGEVEGPAEEGRLGRSAGNPDESASDENQFSIVEPADSPSLGRHHEQQHNQHGHHQGCDQRKRAMQRVAVEVASIVCSEM